MELPEVVREGLEKDRDRIRFALAYDKDELAHYREEVARIEAMIARCEVELAAYDSVLEQEGAA